MVDQRSKRDVNNLTAQRNIQAKYRQHRFPPLRKVWEIPLQSNSLNLNPVEYQKQLKEGFQEGVDKGFSQGVAQGKDEGYKDGLQLGYSEGSKQGELEGKDNGKKLFIQAAQPLSTLVASMQKFLDEYEQRRRKELLQLVEKVTKQVIRCELALQPTQLLALVEEALVGLPSQPTQIKVLLNPEEYERINDAEPEKAREWGLVADAKMALGECHIVTDSAEMDVGCQHRLEQCMDTLTENLLPESENE